jgi:LmbE family N-acetylglucosaminyl deacetylase
MLSLNFGAAPGKPLQVLCIGAHCDDIEIGCGGTVLMLQRRRPACRIHWLVLTSGAARRREAQRSAAAFVTEPCRGEVRICDLGDGLLPAQFGAVKAEFESLKARVDPDLILTHHGADLHQDHRLLSQVTWQTFRNHMIWEYEIPKYDGDLRTPNLYVALPPAVAARKTRLIMKLFASQAGKSWFRAENLDALMRLRGLESRAASGLAEGFHCRKLAFDAAPAPAGARRGKH